MEKSLDEFLADIRKEGKLKVVCGICKKTTTPGPDDNVSHGECEPCSTKKMWLGGVPEAEITELNKSMEGKP